VYTEVVQSYFDANLLRYFCSNRKKRVPNTFIRKYFEMLEESKVFDKTV